ncbi:reverse transcriptase [Gossypium australe]|uniref:Reverse transcriptase n=1 Tax=Gossypium australe TaxID=47621 RepID=A0A5B6VDD3_9ROSI|nr:reverse transcriptase [Gossypium australe]
MVTEIRRNLEGLKKKLTKELEILLEGDRNDDTMAKIIDTKIHLNLEIDKDEMYIAFFHKCVLARSKNLFKSKGVANPCKVLEGIDRIIKQNNDFLLKSFQDKEIKVALEAYEILQTVNQERTGKKGIMAIKLDMSKAYDRVK